MSPELLPPIPQMRRIAQSLAMLDAILCPEWDFRYYSFNSRWAPGEEMASMRNGSGDDWFLLFDANGAALKGFSHELATDENFAGEIQRQVPKTFSSFLNEPAFSMQDATYCYWRRTSDTAWSQVGSTLEEDGSDERLSLFILGPNGYKEWAEEYFEVPVDLDAVAAVFAHQPLTAAIVHALNPEADFTFVQEQAEEIGYPG